MNVRKLITIIILFLSVYGLMFADAPKSVPTIAIEKGKQEEAMALKTNNFQLDGIASFYAEDFHQKTTANGEQFNMNAYTAAHRTLPFNSVVEVTNLNNGKRVTVRINDRGPYLKNRVIDLSKKAAQTIEMLGVGTAPVSLRVIRLGKRNIEKTTNVAGEIIYNTDDHVMIQIASYSQMANANKLVSKLDALNLESNIEQEGHLYRVVLDNISPGEVNPVVKKLRAIGFNNVLVRHSKFE